MAKKKKHKQRSTKHLHVVGQSLVFIEIVIPSYDAPASEQSQPLNAG
jgi:hypothetical protein